MFPILALLLLGGIDLARAVYAYNTVANAAREGARVAKVNQIETSPDCNESRPVENPADPHWSIKTCAASAAVTLDVKTADVTVVYTAPSGTTISCNPPQNVGCLATVTVSYTYYPMTPFINIFFPSMKIQSSSQTTIERIFP